MIKRLMIVIGIILFTIFVPYYVGDLLKTHSFVIEIPIDKLKNHFFLKWINGFLHIGAFICVILLTYLLFGDNIQRLIKWIRYGDE